MSWMLDYCRYFFSDCLKSLTDLTVWSTTDLSFYRCRTWHWLHLSSFFPFLFPINHYHTPRKFIFGYCSIPTSQGMVDRMSAPVMKLTGTCVSWLSSWFSHFCNDCQFGEGQLTRDSPVGNVKGKWDGNLQLQTGVVQGVLLKTWKLFPAFLWALLGCPLLSESFWQPCWDMGFHEVTHRIFNCNPSTVTEDLWFWFLQSLRLMTN